MSTGKPSRFLESIKKVHDTEDQEAARKQREAKVQASKQEKIELEGENLARQNIENIKAEARVIISQVPRDIKLSSGEKLKEDFGIVIKEKWLLATRLEGRTLTVGLYYLPAQNNPRLRDKDGVFDEQMYTIDVNEEFKWVWKTKRIIPKSFSKQPEKIFSSDAPKTVLLAEMTEHILNHALLSLEWIKDPSNTQ